MPKEYVERAALLAEYDRQHVGPPGKARELIASFPAADVREVVTCEECDWHVDVGYHYCCKWCAPCPNDSEFFCAYGERPNRNAKMQGESNAQEDI